MFFIFQVWVVCGWLFAVAMYILVCYFPALQVCQDADVCGAWSTGGWVTYYTLNRIMWGFWVCWLIFACGTGYGGTLSTA